MASPMIFPSGSSKSRIAPREFPSTGFDTLPETTIIDEETLSFYKPELFYPVRIGEIFHSKYQVLFKIDYGTTSTVWMCRDLDLDEYVCMKAMIKDYPSFLREMEAYEKLSERALAATNEDESLGMENVRRALDCFKVRRGDYEYHSLIHKPLGFSLDAIQDITGTFVPSLARHFSQYVLCALYFVHGANVMHADVHSNNVLLSIEDDTIIQELEEDELKNPSGRRITEHSAVFKLKGSDFHINLWVGDSSRTVLCDFSEARIGKQDYEVIIQPPQYRAPEVFLHLPWSTPVDIWSFGCMAWYFATGKNLFSLHRDAGSDSEGVHLARMAMILGPPPQSLLKESGQRVLEFFNEDGSSKYDVPHMTLESLLVSDLEEATYPMTPEQQTPFLVFIRRALTWEADKRASALELLKDPYFAQEIE